MRRLCLYYSLILMTTAVYAAEELDFEHIYGQLEQHPLIKSESSLAEALTEKARADSSLGDPMVMAELREVPLSSLSLGQMDRTEMMVGISQRLSFSGRVGAQRQALRSQAKGQEFVAQDKYRRLSVLLWELAIERQSLRSQRDILSANLDWVKDMLEVSNSLYSRGEIGQQNIFDLRIRVSDLESEIVAVENKLKTNQSILQYLMPETEDTVDLNLASVPWSYIDQIVLDTIVPSEDFQLRGLEAQREAAKKQLSASRRGRIPDPTVGVSYMKMKNMMGDNDFVGMSISFPLPVSSERHARVRENAFRSQGAESRYRHYKIERHKKLDALKNQIATYQEELTTLEQYTLSYAESSREITASAYRRGAASYVELQNSELTLQAQRLRREKVQALLRMKKVEYIYLKGGELYAADS